jgi:hypothetical protein
LRVSLSPLLKFTKTAAGIRRRSGADAAATQIDWTVQQFSR